MAEIALRDVEKYFGDLHVIRKLNLTVRHQEFVVLLGPSGCGKTTTLRSIAGLEEIDSGDIVIDGRAVQNLKAADRDIAFVFQFFALYPHLTAYENIAFPLRATRESRATVDAQVNEVARALRIEHLLQKRPSQLSGGDMQRVAIGRALVRRPKAMLMDEPIGALDAKLREEMRGELKRLHLENGTTTVYVTHDQVEAMALADRIAIMNDGLLQQAGTPSEVYQHPTNLFVAQFIGSPVMNVSRASLRAEDGQTTVVFGDGDGLLRFSRTNSTGSSPLPATPSPISWSASGPRTSSSPGRRPRATSPSRRISSSRSAPTTSSTSSSASNCCAPVPRAAMSARWATSSGPSSTRRRPISSARAPSRRFR